MRKLEKILCTPNTTKKVPTRIGISLRLGERNVLMDKIDLLYDKFSELRTVKPCYADDSHMHMDVYQNCSECCPKELYEIE